MTCKHLVWLHIFLVAGAALASVAVFAASQPPYDSSPRFTHASLKTLAATDVSGKAVTSACHRVNDKGVPVQLQGTEYFNDYWASVVLLHAMREGDQKLPVNKLMEKFPYKKAQKIVVDGWE